jgi:hypothetical protein
LSLNTLELEPYVRYCTEQKFYSGFNGATLTFVKEITMSIVTILLIVLILMLVGAFPRWPHSREWGYGPSGGLGLVFVVLLILLLMGRI